MRKILALTLVIIMIAGIVGCAFLPEDFTVCTVNFYIDGELYETKTTFLGNTVGMPKFPSKENQIFKGWYLQGTFARQYDFSDPVIANLDLHAEFVLDATKLTNMLTTETMKSVVTIYNKCYNTTMGGLVELNSLTSQGSGVVFDIADGYCYVLTNAHVVFYDDKYSKQSITVEDAWGNEFEAFIYQHYKSSQKAFDTSYDLAVIGFKYTNTESPNIEKIAVGDDPKVGDYVVSLGAPLNQKNAITYGKVLTYDVISSSVDSAVSNVHFETILHNALIDRGSSGGPLLNAAGELVGLNFAGYTDQKYGSAIPISKIHEFLSLYVYIK